MVDKQEILKTLNEYFYYDGEVSINNKTGLVSVTRFCQLCKIPPNGRLPVSFDKVGGFFACYSNNLITLEGSPPSMNNHDFGCFNNPLINLNGLSENINELYIHYSPNLPILKAVLNSRYIEWYNTAPKIVDKLTNKYCGQGKAKMAKCAIELVKAGYERNARLW